MANEAGLDILIRLKDLRLYGVQMLHHASCDHEFEDAVMCYKHAHSMIDGSQLHKNKMWSCSHSTNVS